MESDINKIIQEQTNLYSERIKKNTSFKSNERIAATAGFARGATIVSEIILSKWQEAERWRKCGEHRPAVDEHLMYSYTCIVRLESGAYAIAVYHSCGAWMESGTEEYLETVIEWKPLS